MNDIVFTENDIDWISVIYSQNTRENFNEVICENFSILLNQSNAFYDSLKQSGKPKRDGSLAYD